MTDYNHKPSRPPKLISDPLAAQAAALKNQLAKWLRSAGTPLDVGPVILKNTLTSTQDCLLEQLNPTHQGLTVISALNQTQARGQHQRRWQTRNGDLALSAALPIHSDQIACLPELPLWVALKIAQKLNACSPTRTRIWLKWPNDLVMEPARSKQSYLKLGGILCQFVPVKHDQLTEDLTSQNPHSIAGHVVMGVGINRLHVPSAQQDMGDLQQAGIFVELDELRLITAQALICACLNTGLIPGKRASTPPDLAEHYNPKHLLSGHRVTLLDGQSAEPLSSGRCEGINSSGAIVIFDEHTRSARSFFSGQLRLADSS